MNLRPSIPFNEDYSLGGDAFGINKRISDVASSTKREQPDGSELFESARGIDDERGDLFGDPRFNEMNSMIHYNTGEWGNLSASELEPVVDHWREFEDSHYCSECDSMVRYSKDGDWKWFIVMGVISR